MSEPNISNGTRSIPRIDIVRWYDWLNYGQLVEEDTENVDSSEHHQEYPQIMVATSEASIQAEPRSNHEEIQKVH